VVHADRILVNLSAPLYIVYRTERYESSEYRTASDITIGPVFAVQHRCVVKYRLSVQKSVQMKEDESLRMDLRNGATWTISFPGNQRFCEIGVIIR